MAYDEELAARVRKLVARQGGYSERKMFGGLCFMISGNMACGVLADALIVRVPKEDTAGFLKRNHTRPFDFTGKALRGFVVVEACGLGRSDAVSR
jgi:TfoX/Sxy family transcriptional regulator of competence genes